MLPKAKLIICIIAFILEGANNLIKAEVVTVEEAEDVVEEGEEEEVALKRLMLQQKILMLNWMLIMKRFDYLPWISLLVFIYSRYHCIVKCVKATCEARFCFLY